MHTLAQTCTLFVALLAVSAFTVAEDRFAPEPAPAVPPKIVKPAPGPPIVQPPIQVANPKWELAVQEKPLHGEKSWGAAAVPSSSNGLRVTLRAEQNQFPSNGPLSFRVELENTTDAPLTLNAANQLGGTPKLVMAHQQTAAQWSVEGEAKKEAAKPVTIAAGQTLAYTIVIKAEGLVQPQPFPAQPRPRPIPLNEGNVQPLQAQPVPERRIRLQPGQVIVRPAIVGWAQVPVGQGPVRAQLFLDFPRQEGEKVWSGRLASKPVDFTIGNPLIQPRPAVRAAEK